MDDDPLVSNEGRELHASKDTSRQNTSKMQHDANPVAREVEVVIAFAWRCRVAACWVGGTEVAIEVEVHEAGKGKAEECARENEPEDEVVSFAEAKGVVDLASHSVGGVLWGMGWGDHVGGLVWSVALL